MTRIVVHGAAGRMGREVIAAALADPSVQIVGAVARPGSSVVGRPLGEIVGNAPSGVAVSDCLQSALTEADVVVDFSQPEPSLAAATICRIAAKPIVIGTTGFSESQLTELRSAAEDIPVFFAPNMSVGVNLLLKVLPAVAQALAGYDIEIVESHHRFKKDAPSGTALKLAEVITAALNVSLAERARYGRQGLAPRQSGEIGIHAVRAGGIVGEHAVRFVNDGEEVTIAHRAFSRQTFALGAIRAAKFLATRSPGFYSFDDLLAE